MRKSQYSRNCLALALIRVGVGRAAKSAWILGKHVCQILKNLRIQAHAGSVPILVRRTTHDHFCVACSARTIKRVSLMVARMPRQHIGRLHWDALLTNRKELSNERREVRSPDV